MHRANANANAPTFAASLDAEDERDDAMRGMLGAWSPTAREVSPLYVNDQSQPTHNHDNESVNVDSTWTTIS